MTKKDVYKVTATAGAHAAQKMLKLCKADPTIRITVGAIELCEEVRKVCTGESEVSSAKDMAKKVVEIGAGNCACYYASCAAAVAGASLAGPAAVVVFSICAGFAADKVTRKLFKFVS